jgi:ATP/maltotriose-dependent transcriptional regulator MalT
VQAFFDKTAYLDRLCGSLCDTVTGTSGGQAMLQRLAAANLFLVPLDQEQRWYRYHHLFADVLQARLLSAHPAETDAVHARAAAWYEAEGMTADAIEHALIAGEFEQAVRILRRQTSEVGRPGETDPIVMRLERFLDRSTHQKRPDSVLEARVLLSVLLWTGGRREQAVAALEPALTQAERERSARRFVEAGPTLTPVLRQAAAVGIEPEFIGTLLAATGERKQSAGSPPDGSAPGLIEPLSDRELEVLRLVAAGLANAEIAEQLFLAVGTVKRHVFNLYGKLGANSRTSAVARARELGLL